MKEKEEKDYRVGSQMTGCMAFGAKEVARANTPTARHPKAHNQITPKHWRSRTHGDSPNPQLAHTRIHPKSPTHPYPSPILSNPIRPNPLAPTATQIKINVPPPHLRVAHHDGGVLPLQHEDVVAAVARGHDVVVRDVVPVM